MKTIWQRPVREELVNRLNRLSANAPAKWGKFTAPQMVSHLIDGVHMALGELPVKQRKLPIRFFPLKQLVIYAFPFPKGAPTAPELLARTPQEWNGEVAQLKELMERFATGSHSRLPDHPAFGKMSRTAWGVLGYKHIDHHLRQFGV